MIYPLTASANAEAVLFFWFHELKPHQWWRRDGGLDSEIAKRFGPLHEAADCGRLDVWSAAPRTALARIIVLDQFSRNIHRDTPRAFAQDDAARRAAQNALLRRFDMMFGQKERAFFYMPFMHSENLSAQETSLRLFKARLPQTQNVRHALIHHNIIKRFGRFPHRNAILGRQSTPRERSYLESGGFNP
ncbi:MAG: DUF924 family protein [Pseudomonadota bacterium]